MTESEKPQTIFFSDHYLKKFFLIPFVGHI